MATRKRPKRRFGNIRKLPSGRFQARYTAPDGSTVKGPVTFQTRGDADAWLSIEDARITTGQWRPIAPAPPPAPLFSEYADAWLAAREVKPRTRSEYRKLLDKITPEFKGVKLDEITPERVRHWYAGLDSATPTERAHRYSLIRTILTSAVEEELLEANPVHIRGAGRTRRARQIRPATIAEVQAIADAMPEAERLLIHLAAWCALRFGELTELRRKGIDVDGGVILVRRGVTWVRGGDPDEPDAIGPVVGPPKSEAGVRDVHVPPHVAPLVKAHLAQHVGRSQEALLFHGHDGRQLRHATFYEHYGIAREAAGRPDLRLHDLRHTGAVMAAQAGATTKELMSRLGHSTVTMAMRYQHAAADRDKAIADALSKMAQGQ